MVWHGTSGAQREPSSLIVAPSAAHTSTFFYFCIFFLNNTIRYLDFFFLLANLRGGALHFRACRASKYRVRRISSRARGRVGARKQCVVHQIFDAFGIARYMDEYEPRVHGKRTSTPSCTWSRYTRYTREQGRLLRQAHSSCSNLHTSTSSYELVCKRARIAAREAVQLVYELVRA